MPSEVDEQWVEEAFAQHRRSEQLRHEFEARLGTAEVIVQSPDNLIEVLVRADGSIRNVIVVGSLQGLTNMEVSRSIDAAVGAATDAAAWARRTLQAEILNSY